MEKNGAECLEAPLSLILHVRTGRKVRGLSQFNCCEYSWHLVEVLKWGIGALVLCLFGLVFGLVLCQSGEGRPRGHFRPLKWGTRPEMAPEEGTPPLVTTMLAGGWIHPWIWVTWSHSKLFWSHSLLLVSTKACFFFFGLKIKPQCCGGSRVCSVSECQSALPVSLPGAGWPHDSPVGSSWASKVQIGIWEQLVDKWLRLKRSFSCLLQRQEQMFPIKLWLLRCGCLADNKQHEQALCY